MRLGDDQRALLQLLLEREHGYEDIASLLGIGAEEARDRARAALAEMAGTDPDADVALTDYLLGQADAISRADVERHLDSDPEARRLANKLSTQLRLLAPAAELPAAGEGAPAGPKQAPAPAKPSPRPSPPMSAARKAKAKTRRPSLAAWIAKLPSPSGIDRRIAAAAGGGVLLVILVVLLVTGVFGGGGGNDETTAKQATTANGTGAGQATRAVLRPVGDQSDAVGVALFGRTQRNQAAIRVQATGLEPSPKGSSYMLWLYKSPNLALRFGSVSVGQDGQLGVQVAIPTQALALVATGTFDSIDISLASDATYNAEQERANSAQQAPRYVGDSLLRGPIVGPLVAQPAASGG